MSDPRIDPTLAEVRRWREEAQKDFLQLDPETAVETVHRRTEELMRTYGLDLKIEGRDTVKT